MRLLRASRGRRAGWASCRTGVVRPCAVQAARSSGLSGGRDRSDIGETQSGMRIVLVLLPGQQAAAGVHDDEPRTEEEDEGYDHGGDDHLEEVGVFAASAEAAGG